jgi:transposase InsO family protein/predicted aspartyl protease
LAGNPGSCIIKIGKMRYRTLIDTGADTSLISKKMFDKLVQRPKLIKEFTNLTVANGESLTMVGKAILSFTMNRLPLTHKFSVVEGLTRNFILGRDWLKANGVRIYFDLGSLRIKNTYVQLEEDIHISSILRLNKKTLIKPQTGVICYVKLNNAFHIPESGILEVTNLDPGCIQEEPGLTVQESVHTVKTTGKIPVLVVNQTNRHFNLKRGSVIGKGRALRAGEVSTIAEEQKDDDDDTGKEDEEFNEIKVPEEYRSEVVRIVKQNIDLFAKTDIDLGHTDTVKMTINTGEHPPIKNRPYRAPLNKRKIIDKALVDMLEAKVIERSQSPWAFPLVVVKKKDGSNRMCVDFRSLNKITKPTSFPLPLIDDILALLGKSNHYTTLDLKSGYYQVLLDNESREKTAFACHKGLYQFLVMPFGLSSAPGIFQELMNIVLQGCEDFATAYLDDVIIFSASPQEHIKHVQTVLDRLRQHGLKLKLKKCAFFEEETEYLGFKVGKDGVKPNPEKVEAIKNLPVPRNVREVRGIIGTCSYYRRFIPNFSKIAEPIIYLTRKNARFKWTEECQVAFDFLKESLMVVPLLVYPDTNKPYVLYTDASDNCIGACLTQESDEGEEKPIYFLSHKLSPTQTRWSTIEKEGFAIYYALQKLDLYLHGSQFVIRTDHKPLKYILDAKMENKKIARWALSVAGYNCKVEYIEGKENHCADLLSRIPWTQTDQDAEQEKVSESADEPDIDDRAFEINTLNSNEFNPKDYASCQVDPPGDIVKPKVGLLTEIDMKEKQNADEKIGKLKKSLHKGTANKTEYKHHMEVEGLLYYLSQPDSDEPRLRLYIPGELEQTVIEQFHDRLGHMALDKTYDSIAKKYFFSNMYKKINSHIEKCITCQTRSDRKSRPPVQEVDIPPYPFAKIGLDLSGPYPTTLSGNKYVVSFIDWYSGWPEAFCVPDKSADNIAHLLIEEIFPRYGCPLQLVSDNGTENINRKVRETLEALNIHHVQSNYYSPQANGKVERFHRTLHDVLAKKIEEDVQTWDLYLNQTLAAIRFHENESLKFSPFSLVYNRDVVLPLDTILKPRRRYMGEDQYQIALNQQHKSFVLVHRHTKEARKRRKKYADRHSKEEKFQVGDPVYLKNHRKTNKLDNKWTPYYRIIEQTGPVSFIVKNQLNGTTTKTHARHIRPANIAEWPTPTPSGERLLRKSNYVIPPEESDDEETEETALDRAVRFKRQERADSSDEDDIPLAELRRRIQTRNQSDLEEQVNDYPLKSESDETDQGESDSSNETVKTELQETDMEVDMVKKPETCSLQTGIVSDPPQDSKLLVKNLLTAIEALL